MSSEDFLYQYQFLSYMEDEDYGVTYTDEPELHNKGKDKDKGKSVEPDIIEIECKICFIEYKEEEGVYLNCGDFVCKECLEMHLQASVDNNETVKCPIMGCDTVLMNYEVERYASSEVRQKIESQALEKILNTGALPCPTPDCTNRFFIDESFLLNEEGKGVMIMCDKCFQFFCSACKDTYHYHSTCEEYKMCKAEWKDELEFIEEKKMAQKMRKPVVGNNKHPNRNKMNGKNNKPALSLSNREQYIMDELWKEKNCRHCPNCNKLIERTDGCDNMRCGTEDIYNIQAKLTQNGCGKKFQWPDAKPYVMTRLNKNVVESPEEKEFFAIREKRMDELSKLRVVDLKPMLKKYGLPVGGIKKALVLRIFTHEIQEAAKEKLANQERINTEAKAKKEKEKEVERVVERKCNLCETGAKAAYCCLQCDEIFPCQKCMDVCLEHEHRQHIFKSLAQ